jgi:hypothetical protein
LAQAGRTSSTMRMVHGVVEYSAARLQQDWRLVGVGARLASACL